MALGFTPKHKEEFSFTGSTSEQFLVLISEASIKMGWSIGYLNHNGIIAYTNNGMFSANSEIKINIKNGLASIQSSSTGSEMIDWGKNKKNVKNFISTCEELKKTLSIEELDTKFQEIKNHFVEDGANILNQSPTTTTENVKDFFSIFKPTKGFFITPILLDLNILLFILLIIGGANIISPDSQSLLNWGANYKPLTLGGEWWRLITNCFLHIGVIHLLMNMYALLYIGVLLEPFLGRTRFIIAYLLTGVTASVTSLWWHDLTISAGASGAIFGMYGVFLAMLTTNLIEKTARKAMLTSIGVFVGYNLIFGLQGGIDNAAHIGGLLGGLIIGYAFIPSLKKPHKSKLKFGTLGLLCILIPVSSFVICKNISNDIGIYETKMKEFVAMESKALEIYNMPENTPNDKILSEIKNKGIYNWTENIKLINSFKELDLPNEIVMRNKILKEYCELRLKSNELLYKAISENTENYQEKLEDYNKQIEAKINELNLE